MKQQAVFCFASLVFATAAHAQFQPSEVGGFSPSRTLVGTSTAALYAKMEHRAVAFGSDEKENSKKLNELGAEGWEYVGPLNNTGMVAFKRPIVAAQRMNIVGKWELDVGKDKCVVELNKFGKMNVTGNAFALKALFEDIPAIINLGGSLQALGYEIPDEGRFAFTVDINKLELAAEKINELPSIQRALKERQENAGPGGFPGAALGGPAGRDRGERGLPSLLGRSGRLLYTMDINEATLTLTRGKDALVLKRVK